MEGKPYGKLTEEQFRRLIQKLPEIRSSERELVQAIKAASKERLRELLRGSRCWSYVYEIPFAQHVAFVLVALGQKRWLGKVNRSNDPQEAVLQSLYGDPDDWDEPATNEFRTGDLVLLTTTLQRTVLSIMVFKQSLSALTEQARKGGDASLLNVIRLDRSAVATPPKTNPRIGPKNRGRSAPYAQLIVTIDLNRLPGSGQHGHPWQMSMLMA